MKTTLLIALASLLLVGGEAQAQMARQEFYPLQSVTLSDADFLAGKKEGVPVTLVLPANLLGGHFQFDFHGGDGEIDISDIVVWIRVNT